MCCRRVDGLKLLKQAHSIYLNLKTYFESFLSFDLCRPQYKFYSMKETLWWFFGNTIHCLQSANLIAIWFDRNGFLLIFLKLWIITFNVHLISILEWNMVCQVKCKALTTIFCALKYTYLPSVIPKPSLRLLT